MFSPTTDVIVQSARDLHKGLAIIQQQQHQQSHLHALSPAHTTGVKKLPLHICTDLQQQQLAATTTIINNPNPNSHKKRGGGLYQVTSRKARHTFNQNSNGGSDIPSKSTYSGNRSTAATNSTAITSIGSGSNPQQPQQQQQQQRIQRHQSPAAMPNSSKGKSQLKSVENLAPTVQTNRLVSPTAAVATVVPTSVDVPPIMVVSLSSQSSSNAVDTNNAAVSTTTTTNTRNTTTPTMTAARTASPIIVSNCSTNNRKHQIAAATTATVSSPSQSSVCQIGINVGNMFAIPVTCTTAAASVGGQQKNLALRNGGNSYTPDYLHYLRNHNMNDTLVTTINVNHLPSMQQQAHHSNLVNRDSNSMMRNGGGGRNYSGNGGNSFHYSNQNNNKKSDLSHNGYNGGTINMNHPGSGYYNNRYNHHYHSPQHNTHYQQNNHHLQAYHPNSNYHHHSRNNYQNGGGGNKKNGWNNNNNNNNYKSYYHHPKKMSPTNVNGHSQNNGKSNNNHQNYRIRNNHYSQNPNNLVYATATTTTTSSSRSPTPSPKSESPTLCISSGSGGSSSNQSQHSNESSSDANHRLGPIIPLDNQTVVSTTNSYLPNGNAVGVGGGGGGGGGGTGGGGYESDSSHSSHREFVYRNGVNTLTSTSTQALHQLTDGDFQTTTNSLLFPEEIFRGQMSYYGSHQNLLMWSANNTGNYGHQYHGSPMYNSNSSASSDGSFKNGDFGHAHQRRSHSGGTSPNNQNECKSLYRGSQRRQQHANFNTHNSRENLTTPPDRFLSRSHLVEMKETPADLLTDTKWSGLSQMIWDKFIGAQQTEDTYKKKMQLWKSLYLLIKKSNPRNGLYLVGSTISGFGSDTSDVDMCLVSRITTSFDPRVESLLTLTSLKEFLLMHTDYEHFDLIQAKVPILRFRDTTNQLEVDLNFNNSVGIYNTHLLHCYSQMDWRLRPLALVVKLWAQFHHINNAKNSTISSYSLVLMVIHFLQCAVSPPVLPCLHTLYPEKFQKTHDIRAVDINEVLEPYVSDNKQAIGELFSEFLKYYTTFNYTQYAISVRTASVLNIEDCRLVRSSKNDPHQWKQLCIEEPFDQTNTARSVYDGEVFERIKSVFQMSDKMLERKMDLQSLFTTPFLPGYVQRSSTPPS